MIVPIKRLENSTVCYDTVKENIANVKDGSTRDELYVQPKLKAEHNKFIGENSCMVLAQYTLNGFQIIEKSTLESKFIGAGELEKRIALGEIGNILYNDNYVLRIEEYQDRATKKKKDNIVVSCDCFRNDLDSSVERVIEKVLEHNSEYTRLTVIESEDKFRVYHSVIENGKRVSSTLVGKMNGRDDLVFIISKFKKKVGV